MTQLFFFSHPEPISTRQISKSTSQDIDGALRVRLRIFAQQYTKTCTYIFFILAIHVSIGRFFGFVFLRRISTRTVETIGTPVAIHSDTYTVVARTAQVLYARDLSVTLQRAESSVRGSVKRVRGRGRRWDRDNARRS